MNKELNIKVLRVLMESHSGLEAGSLYSRTNIEFGSFTKALNSLIDCKLVADDDDFITLTVLGKKKLMESKRGKQDQPTLTKDEEFYSPNIKLMRLLSDS